MFLRSSSLLVFLSMGLVACGDDAGAGGGADTSSVSTTATSSSATSSSGGACLGVCSTPPPPGWNGPVLLADDDVESCPSPVLAGGLASEPGVPDSAIEAGAFACGCACVADPASCASVDVDPACSEGADTFAAVPEACSTPPAVAAAADDVQIGAVSPAGTCTPAGEQTAPSGAGFVTPRDVCGIQVTTAGCEGTQVCVPSTDAQVCVWRHGAVGCQQVPAYPNELVLVAMIDDGRACGAGTCTCETAAGGCAGSVELYSDAACATSIATVPAVAGCATLPQPEVVGSARYALTNPSFSCPSEPGGQAVVTGAVGAAEDEVYTLCCRD